MPPKSSTQILAQLRKLMTDKTKRLVQAWHYLIFHALLKKQPDGWNCLYNQGLASLLRCVLRPEAWQFLDCLYAALYQHTHQARWSSEPPCCCTIYQVIVSSINWLMLVDTVWLLVKGVEEQSFHIALYYRWYCICILRVLLAKDTKIMCNKCS